MVRKRALIISINPLLFQFKTQEFQAEMKSLLLMIFGNQEDKPSQEIFQKQSLTKFRGENLQLEN